MHIHIPQSYICYVFTCCCLVFFLVHNISFPPEMKPDKFYVTLQKSNDKSGNGDISRSKDVSVKPNQNHVHMGVTVVLQATMYLSGEGYYNVSIIIILPPSIASDYHYSVVSQIITLSHAFCCCIYNLAENSYP